MKKMDFQKVVEWLSYILKCPVCNYKYNLERTKIVDTKEGEDSQAAILVVHSDCSQCKSSVVFSISINGPDIYSMSMITDLTADELERFADMDPITTHEVLDLHKFMKNFDGNFVKALKV